MKAKWPRYLPSSKWYEKQFPCLPDPRYQSNREPDLVEIFEKWTIGKVEKENEDDDSE